MRIRAKEGSRTLTGVTPLEPESTAPGGFSELWRRFSESARADVGSQKTAVKRARTENTGARTTIQNVDFGDAWRSTVG
jgi:hypothetical protein